MKTPDFSNRYYALMLMAFFLTTATVLAHSSTTGNKRAMAPCHNPEMEDAFTVTLIQGIEGAVYIDASPERAE